MINIDDRLLPKVDENEMWLILHLAKRLGETFVAFPSNKTLLADTSWHIEKLQRVKKSLVEKKLLKIKERKNNSNLYKINTDLIGVFVSGKGKAIEVIECDGISDIPRNFSDLENQQASPGKTDNEVLTTEVLTISLGEREKIIEAKVKAFKKTTYPFIEQYGKAMLIEFCAYWTEPQINGTKLWWEMQKRWDVKRRLANWKRNDDEKKSRARPFGAYNDTPLVSSDPRKYHEPRTP